MQALDLGVRVSMIKPRNRLFCRIDGLTPQVREQQRHQIIKKLGLLEAETVPVFDEATQSASRFLEVPICILTLIVKDKIWFKSASGLSRIGLMNQLAAYRKIPLHESFSTYVIDSQQDLVIEDALLETVFANSSLAQHYGIRAYLGTPLITAEGECIGTLEVMDVESRTFSSKDIEFLALTARWSLREFERDRLLKDRQVNHLEAALDINKTREDRAQWDTSARLADSIATDSNVSSISANSTNNIKIKLLAQLTQDLRTPLTSVIGMASVLRRELYGPLTNKQKEYLEIIHNSGQHLISLVEEIVNLGVLEDSTSQVQMTYVDLEMLCQQVINSLVEIAQQQQQELRLSVEPGNRIWLLDKDKVRQALYYLTISVLDSCEAGGEVRIHVSRKSNMMHIAIWMSHPWLGDGLPQVELYPPALAFARNNSLAIEEREGEERIGSLVGTHVLTSQELFKALKQAENTNQSQKSSREILGLLLSCHLIELQKGQITVQGSPESGYRYVLKLPKLSEQEETNVES
jgi:signal transduction histidine kinase